MVGFVDLAEREKKEKGREKEVDTWLWEGRRGRAERRPS